MNGFPAGAYEQLQNKDSELVVFDVNRFDQLESFIPSANEKPLKHLETRSDLPYRLTVITNKARNSNRMAQRTKAPRSGSIDSTTLGLAWPPGVHLRRLYGTVVLADVQQRSFSRFPGDQSLSGSLGAIPQQLVLLGN